VKIEGTVEGDLIAFCSRLTIDGHITGDVIAFAQIVRINGTVDGNVRSFSSSVTFDGTVAKNVTSFAQNFELASNKEIHGSLMLFAAMASQDGRVGRDLLSMVGQHSLDGFVGGAARMRSDKLTIGPSAEVVGKVQIKSPHEPNISDKAKFGAGKPEITIEKRRPDYTKPGYYWRQTLRWGAAFVLGLLVVLLLPGFLADSVRQGERIGLSFGAGVLALIVTPVAAVVACITIVGLAVGITSLLAWCLAIYSAQVFVGVFLGQKILGPTASTGAMIGRLAVGLLIIRVAGMLPYAGEFAWLAVIIFGMGLVTLAILKRARPAEATAL
jgi:cytoskeletal protein CcmA (bactofilin family)